MIPDLTEAKMAAFLQAYQGTIDEGLVVKVNQILDNRGFDYEFTLGKMFHFIRHSIQIRLWSY